jgi:FAD/FMN-containing dehydrogenase
MELGVKISRRTALHLGAAAALLPLFKHEGLASTAFGGDPPCSAPITDTDLALLEKALPGRVFLAPSTQYEDSSTNFNRRYQTRPIAVVRAASAQDVIAVVQWARVRGVTVSTRSGGHSYIGGCLGEGIVLDVSPLSSIAFQSKTNRVEVGAGTRLGPLYSSLYCDHGQRTLTSGTCLSIGISGITLGGGYNSQSRLSGLTIDSLRSAEVVLADGSLVRADATRETDLFWAIRGGGPSFGVVTALEFETQPWQQFSTVTMTWPWGSSATAFSIWSAWIAGLSMSSTSTSSWASSGTVASQRFRTTVRSLEGSASATALADELERAVGVVSSRVSGVSTTPVCGDDGIATGAPSSNSSLFADGSVTLAGANLIKTAIEARVGHPLIAQGDVASILSHAFGGALARIPSNATAFPHRNARMLTQLISGWSSSASTLRAQANIAWVTDLHTSLRPSFGNGCYFNYANDALTDWRTAYWGSNLAQLERVKQQYDPNRFWRGKQFI